MLIDPSRAAYDKLQASVSEYRKINPHSRDKRYGEGLTFEDFKTRYDAGTDSFQPTYSGPPMQPLQSASGGLGGLLSRFPGLGNATPGPVDPIMQGFQESEFHKNANKMQQDAVDFKYKGKDRTMNSSMHGAFKQYLDSIGKRDLYQGNVFSTPQQPGRGLLSSTPGENPYALNNPSNPLNQLNVTPPEIPVSMQQPKSGLGAPPQGIGSLTPTPQQPMMPENTMGGNNSFGNPLMGGINNLSEFGKPPSFGGNSFGNTMGGNNVFQNPFTGFQSNQQSFNDNQGMSSYIDNLINQRMKDIFGGIMGIFK